MHQIYHVVYKATETAFCDSKVVKSLSTPAASIVTIWSKNDSNTDRWVKQTKKLSNDDLKFPM